MKFTITTTSQTLKAAMWDTKYAKLLAQKTKSDQFTINLQNKTAFDVYIEKWEAATVADWYELIAWNEVEIKTWNIVNINIISSGSDATDIRIIGS